LINEKFGKDGYGWWVPNNFEVWIIGGGYGGECHRRNDF